MFKISSIKDSSRDKFGKITK